MNQDLQGPVTSATVTLVITTLGRVAPVRRLFNSLAEQTVDGFDVIVVDQNDDDRLVPILDDPWPFPVRRVHTPGERGASRGRNRGWRLGRGDIILFPDDDCWYAPGFLEHALETMRRRRCDMLAGRAIDEAGESINGRFEPLPQRINDTNVWTTAIEWMVFFHREVLEAVGGFDEDVGIGAATPWQSCEIQDIIIRAMKAGFVAWFDPGVTGYHERMVTGRPDARLIRKARAYARGMGYVLRLHGYGPATIGVWIVRPLAGGVLAAVRGRWALIPLQGQVAFGRLEGALRRVVDRS